MTAAQVHLALNHFPIAGIILALPILIWGLISKKDQIKSVGIALIIVSSITGFIVAESGDGAEEIVEHKSGVTEHLIHEHEEAADAAMIAIQITAAFAIAWLVMNKLNKNHQDKVLAAILVLNLISAGLVARAAHEGGKIRHDEIRSGATDANLENESKDKEGKEKESESKESEEKEEHEKK